MRFVHIAQIHKMIQDSALLQIDFTLIVLSAKKNKIWPLTFVLNELKFIIMHMQFLPETVGSEQEEYQPKQKTANFHGLKVNFFFRAAKNRKENIKHL
jgi:hypothetical protein